MEIVIASTHKYSVVHCITIINTKHLSNILRILPTLNVIKYNFK